MGIKRAKLNYRPIVKEVHHEIAYVVSRKDINEFSRSVHRKVERNRLEGTGISLAAKEFHVGPQYDGIDSYEYLLKKS